jgi:hypothetical protein
MAEREKLKRSHPPDRILVAVSGKEFEVVEKKPEPGEAQVVVCVYKLVSSEIVDALPKPKKVEKVAKATKPVEKPD